MIELFFFNMSVSDQLRGVTSTGDSNCKNSAKKGKISKWSKDISKRTGRSCFLKNNIKNLTRLSH